MISWRKNEEQGTADGPRPIGLPASQNRGLMARSFAGLYGFGGLLLLVSLALDGPPDRNDAALTAIGFAALAIAAVMAIAWRRLPSWAFPALPLLGTAMVGVCVWFGGPAVSGSYALAFFWSVVAAFYFFRRAIAVATVLVAAAAYGAVLLFKPGVEFGALRWLLLAGSLAASAFLVAYLHRHAEGSTQELADAASTDPLTQLLNRREFDMRLREQIAAAERGRWSLALIAMDLDGLKPINDHDGHGAGDHVLRKVAATLSFQAREQDILARVGGDEFAAVVTNADQAEAYRIAERLREMVRGAFADEERRVTLSAGIAVYGVHGFKPLDLIEAADQALYAAKHRGGDTTVVSDGTIVDKLSRATPQDALGALPSSLDAVMSLAQAVAIRETGSDEHSQAVAANAQALGQWLGMDEARLEKLRLAGLLHDIGKISIPGAILGKTDPLTDAEAEEMRKHPEIGAQILRNARLDEIASWIESHHERPDGLGYPRGLRGEQIPVESRIIAVADANEAMIRGRSYRPAMSQFAASEELRRNAGTQFDDRIVRIFLSLVASNRTVPGPAGDGAGSAAQPSFPASPTK